MERDLKLIGEKAKKLLDENGIRDGFEKKKNVFSLKASLSRLD